MALIFLLSSQNAAVSSGTSGNVIRLIAGIFRPGFGSLPAAEQAENCCVFAIFGQKIGAFLLIYDFRRFKFSCDYKL